MTLRAGQTFSPIQNDRKVQVTAKYRDKGRGERASLHTQRADSQSKLVRSQTRERDNDGSCSAESSRGTQRSSEGCQRDTLPEAPEAPATRQRSPQCERDEEDRDLQDRKQEIRDYREARHRRLEHSTARSRFRGPRRVQAHVHDGRGVDGDGCEESENHIRAETDSSESNRCEVTSTQKMARNATEEQKAAEMKDKNRLRSSTTETTGAANSSTVPGR